MNTNILHLPPQQLPLSKKTAEWRKKHLDWADKKTFFHSELVRSTIIHKKINYDLLNGKLHMQDIKSLINPYNQDASFFPEKIQHYPLMNNKLNVLRGEEASRPFDFKVIVTNPNVLSEIAENKKNELFERVKKLIEGKQLPEEEFNKELEKINDYYTYTWQDIREVRANILLNHYVKEYNMPLMFTGGFMDAMAVAEEIYQCDIVGGEPVVERVNPLKIRAFCSGYSSKIEDADIIVLEDYWSPGKIIDTFYDSLTAKDRKYIENLPETYESIATDSAGNIEDILGFRNMEEWGNAITSQEGFFWDPISGQDSINSSLLPYDMAGNLRVLRVYWKSRRKIKKIKSYDYTTGEEIFTFQSENYILDENAGEEEVGSYYINQAWEGTKIGDDIYINMRPRVVQYNSLSNPSKCHFGIIGSIYNINESKPFSMIDMMKPFNYLYDIIYDRLLKLLSHNMGKIIELDLAKVPDKWDVSKWMYFAKVNGIAVVDSFKEGRKGAATGKLAGAMNNASSGVIDADWGNNIQQHVNFLEFIKMEMSEAVGISKQREGQISNRETVGGVERATLQSSHITEWLFGIHEDVKKRVLECFLETAKIALRGQSKKFQYILPDMSQQIMTIEGDEFAECDYGLVVDNSNGTRELNSKLDMLAQAALQNQMINFSTVMKLYSSCSLAEKQRMIEKNENEIMQRQQEAQQQEQQLKQQEIEQKTKVAEAQMQQQDALNQRDNETKIAVAQINSQAELAILQLKNASLMEEPVYTQEAKEKLLEQMREFDAKLNLDKSKLEEEKRKNKANEDLKRKQINKPSKTK